MPSLSLTLCGSVGVAGDGVAPDTIGSKSLALLAYLALEPGAHSRDELTALLWGEYPEEKAKASLRQALTHLREAVPRVLRVDRASTQSLNPGAKRSSWASIRSVISSVEPLGTRQ